MCNIFYTENAISLFTPRTFPFFLVCFVSLIYTKVVMLNANELILGQVPRSYFKIIILAFYISDILHTIFFVFLILSFINKSATDLY